MAGVEPFAPQVIGEVLKQDHKLATLLAQVRLHDRLLGRIRQTLPKPVDAHCLCCVLRGGRLILYTDSAAWALKLRFYQGELRSALDEIGPLNTIQVRILLPTGRVEKSLPSPTIPAPEVLDQLEKYAATVADPQIKHALQRLVCTLRRAQSKP